MPILCLSPLGRKLCELFLLFSAYRVPGVWMVLAYIRHLMYIYLLKEQMNEYIETKDYSYLLLLFLEYFSSNLKFC